MKLTKELINKETYIVTREFTKGLLKMFTKKLGKKQVNFQRIKETHKGNKKIMKQKGTFKGSNELLK